jgi:hypothetical protein
MVSSTGADTPELLIAGLGDSFMEEDWLSAVTIPGHQLLATFNAARRKARREHIGRYGDDRTLLGSVQAGAQKLQLAALAEFASNLEFPLDVTFVYCCGVDAGFGEVMWRTSRLGPGWPHPYREMRQRAELACTGYADVLLAVAEHSEYVVAMAYPPLVSLDTKALRSLGPLYGETGLSVVSYA